MIFQNLAFYIDGSSILRGECFFICVFVVFFVLFGGIVFDTFIEHVEFDMQITILSGLRAS